METRNLWSTRGGQEIQRSDLWRLDLTPVLRLIQQAPGIVPSLEYIEHLAEASKAENHLSHFAARLVFPDQTMDRIEAMNQGAPELFPGFDVPSGVTRLDLLHEHIPSEIGVPGAIYALFRCWQFLAMAGQQIGSTVPAPLASPTSVPIFAVDLPILLQLGANEAGESLDLRLMLVEAWVSGLQLGDLDKTAAANALVLTATLQSIDLINMDRVAPHVG